MSAAQTTGLYDFIALTKAIAYAFQHFRWAARSRATRFGHTRRRIQLVKGIKDHLAFIRLASIPLANPSQKRLSDPDSILLGGALMSVASLTDASGAAIGRTVRLDSL